MYQQNGFQGPPQYQEVPQSYEQPQYQQPYEQQDASGQPHTYQGIVRGLQGWNDAPSSQQQVDLSVLSPSSSQHVSSWIASLIQHLRQAKGQHSKVIDDSEKRLESLVHALSANALPQDTLSRLVLLQQGMNDQHAATTQVKALLAAQSGDDQKWALGLKRLVDLAFR